MATSTTTTDSSQPHPSPSAATAATESLNLRERLQRDGKSLPKIPTAVFVVFIIVIVPFWLFVLVPLTIFYQVVWKIFLCKILLKRKSTVATTLKSVVPSPETVPSGGDRPYDVVVLGATGFTGTLAVQYLLRQYRDAGSKSNIRFAMAGRSLSKLQALQARLVKEFQAKDDAKKTDALLVEIIVVDTLIPAQVISLVQKTKAVVNFVGPFHLYGGTIVMEACAKYGTHYLDITGEMDWVKDMLMWSPNNDGTTLDDIARQTGAKLINCCGNDCIPWDITFFKVHELLKKQDVSEDLVHLQVWDEIMASPSGGTIATMIATIQGKDPTQPAPVVDPFLKLPNGSISTARLVEDAQWWIGKTSPSPQTSMLLSPSYPITAPFILAPMNAMILTRSLALLSGTNPNETTLRYREAAVYPDFKTAFVSTFAIFLALTIIMLSELPPVDYLLQKIILKSGEGPSLEAQQKNYLFLIARGTGSRGTIVEAAIYFSKDPGYMDTARMAVESSLCLVDPDSLAKLPSKTIGGLWTPSAALGNVLLERLVNTGTHFEMQVIPRAS